MKKQTEDGHVAEQSLQWLAQLLDRGWVAYIRVERGATPGMLAVYAVADCALPNGDQLPYRREWERVSSTKPGALESAMLRATVRLFQSLDGIDPRDAALLVNWNREARRF